MSVTRRSPAKRKHLAGLFRVLAYTAGVGVVCGALSIRAARAEVGDQSLVIGRQMVELAKSAKTEVTHLTFNGQPMFVGNSITGDDVTSVLDRYEAHCRANAAQTPESWREIAKKVDESEIENKRLFKAGLLRSGAGDLEGTVVCFERSAESKSTLTEAFNSFGETGDLGAFGQLRYVYAKRTTNGNTHVLTAWTATKFTIKDMMPADDGRDVPGSDFSELPRPENARRVLSTRLEGTPFGVNTYTTDAAPEKVAAYYDEALIKQGWFALDAELGKRTKDPSLKGVVAHLYEKDGVVLTLAAHRDAGRTFATLGLAGVAPDEKTTSAPSARH